MTGLKSYGQCITLNSSNTGISFSNDRKEVIIESTSKMDLSSVRMLIYDYQGDYYTYDSWNREKVNNITGLQINRSYNKVNISGLIKGDYIIIFEQQNCKKQILGQGFSGFPLIGIQVD